MSKHLKFTVGKDSSGYKTVEISIGDKQIEYKILRNELNPVDKNQKFSVPAPEGWIDEFNALNIFGWEKTYVGDKNSDGERWQLTLKDGKKIYHGRGANAHPDDWDEFLDLLDALIPEIEFLDGKRVESIELRLSRDEPKDELQIIEKLTLARYKETLIIKKESSAHAYNLGMEDTKNFLDVCQKYFGGLEVNDFLEKFETPTKLFYLLNLHDGTNISGLKSFNDHAMTGIVPFIKEIHSFAADLSAEIFSPDVLNVNNDNEKIILCKVQFKGNYKSYTYRAEDETLAVGDVVDVPVGRNNDVTQAKIVDIGYFDAAEAPCPVDKIKMIIGKHVANEWESPL